MFPGVRSVTLTRALRMAALTGNADAAHVLKMRKPPPKLPRMPKGAKVASKDVRRAKK